MHFRALRLAKPAVTIPVETGERLLATGLSLGAPLLASGFRLGIFSVVQPAVVVVIKALKNLRAHLAKTAGTATCAPVLSHLRACGLAFALIEEAVAVLVEAFDHFGVARAGAAGTEGGGFRGWLALGEDGDGE